jgi:hypothetical protein
MEGVAEEVVAQQANVDAAQAEIEAAVAAARAALEAALTSRLNDSVDTLDAKVAELAQELYYSETSAVAGVGGDREIWEEEIRALREQLLWDIKELVFRLGYTQGYVYGTHDGEDHEILEMIKAKKDEFEAFNVAQLQRMEDRKNAEEAAGDERYAAAVAELDAEKARLSEEMDAAIAAAIASFDETLAGAKTDFTGAIADATDALYAFIEGRLAVWAALAHEEEKNAKWQEDSYYRYHLLVLLQEKQASIDQAVADVKAAWASAMAGEQADATAFRGAMREGFADFTAATRQSLSDAMEQDWADMEAILEEREASLDAGLADQQGSFVDAVNACRDEMKRRLKEVYNYNSYDIDLTKTQETIAAPYSHEQHVAFLHKFAYYLKDSYSKFDGRLTSMYE